MGIEMLAGAGIFALGAVFGRFVPGRRKGPKPAKPVCGCEHAASYHDPQTRECHKDVYQSNGRYVRCRCRQYTGPEPMPEYYAPEIGG